MKAQQFFKYQSIKDGGIILPGSIDFPPTAAPKTTGGVTFNVFSNTRYIKT